MATNTYNSQILKVDESNLTLRTQGYYSGAVVIPANETDTLTNTLSSTSYSVPSNDPTYPFPSLMNSGTKTFPLTSTTAFGQSVFPDGVYHLSLSAVDSIDPTTTYVSNAYQLFKYNIDAAWALFQTVYNPSNSANLATYNAITASYATITLLQGNLAANYVAINAEITNIANQLNAAIIIYDGSPTLTLQSATTFGLSVDYQVDDVIISSSSTIVGMSNTGTKSNFPNISQTSPISTTATASSLFSLPSGSFIPDSVYYVDMASQGTYIGEYNSARAYCLVTTTIDARWASFQENYDPTNPSNLAIFNNVTTAYADIATLSANLAANYTTINTKITYINTQLDSATFNITVNVSLSSATTLLASTTFYNGGISTDVADFTVDNLTTNQTKVYNATPELTIEATGTKSKSFVSGSPIGSPNYNDGVLEVTLYYHEENGTWEWTSVSYVLVTTAIDASIDSFDTSTLLGVCKKRALEYYRDLLQAAFDAADYTLCTDYFNAINTMLLGMQAQFEGTLSLVDNNTLNIVVPSVGNTDLFYQTSQLWNTYTQVLGDSVEVSNQFLVPSGSGSLSIDSSDTLSLPIYSDGVYLFETYCVCQDGVDFDSNPIFASVVTTTIDAEFAIFEANYDPDNAAQAASYAAMLAAYAEIQTLSSNVVANYADINDQIAIIQDNLALWVELNMSLVLTNKSTMTLTINSTIPNVVYSEQSLTLNNTNDDSQEYTITTFPENYIDLTKTFSSSAINFGSQYDDAVYKVNLSWTADNGMEFSGVAYCLVMTQVNCGIAQIIAERPNCKQLQSKLNYLMTFRDMAIDAYSNADYSTCNFYINKCIVILNQSGCGCGCN